MASEIIVNRITGPSTGANANKVIIPSGQTLQVDGDTSGISSVNILEQVGGPCDGSTRTTKSGTTFTLPNVTAYQLINGTSYVDVTGSSCAYHAPAGAIGVRYTFKFGIGWHDTQHSIQHFRLYVDGNEITHGRRTMGGYYVEDIVDYDYYFPITGTNSYPAGKLASWNTSRTVKIMSRAYASSHGIERMHGTQYWDGGGGNQFTKPQIYFTAYGASS